MCRCEFIRNSRNKQRQQERTNEFAPTSEFSPYFNCGTGSERGFTLLEVMVALSIIATALVTLLGTHLMSLNLAQKNREQTLAALLTRQKMEEILTSPFDSLASGSGDFESAYPNCEWELDVEDADVKNLKKVTIKIKFPDGEFELETFVARAVVE